MSYIIGLSPEEKKQIEDIEHDDSKGDLEKSQLLHETMKNIKQKPKKSSNTIFNVANTMMGSALLVMPINYYDAGVLSACIAAGIVAYISYKTANLVILHSIEEEIDYPEAVNRILGKKWEFFYNLLSMFLLFLVGVIHFILMSHSLYSVLKNIFPDSDSWPSSDTITWDQFSLQYVGIIIFVVCFVLYLFEDLTIVLKINDKGVYMIMVFCLYALYLGIYGIVNYDFTFVLTGHPGKNRKGLELVLFTFNIETLVGIFGLAYMIHNVVNGIMKSNPQEIVKNSRDLRTAYILVFVLYCILGIFGMFAVAYLYHENYTEKLPETIMDLIVRSNPGMTGAQNILGIFSLLLVFTQLTTVIPILLFFTRRQFFNLMYLPGHQIAKWQFHSFNMVFNIASLVIQLMAFNINVVISITGAVGGFFLCYVIPISLHIKCLYWPVKSSTSPGDFKKVSNSSDELETKKEESSEELIKSSPKPPRDSAEEHQCVDHTEIMKDNRQLTYAYWTVIGLLGTSILVIQFVKLFS